VRTRKEWSCYNDVGLSFCAVFVRSGPLQCPIFKQEDLFEIVDETDEVVGVWALPQKLHVYEDSANGAEYESQGGKREAKRSASPLVME
jgi:hypothetical protein